MNETPRELDEFLRGCLGERLRIDALPGDASARAYYRVSTETNQRYMVAYYPESLRPGIERFLTAYGSIADHAPVPAVYHHGACAVVQQDVGDLTLFELLETDPARALRLYRRAIDLLAGFQGSSEEARGVNPRFTEQDFTRELSMTCEYWVERMCGVVEREVLEALDHAFRRLAGAIVRHPYVLCHRDFHGQNLHVLDDGIYMIDYQDLRLGPDTYDLASLLRDRGVARAIGADAEKELIEYYRERTGGDPGLERRYFETLLQRSIKILGTFARQSITRGRHHYLAYIPPTLESIRLCVDRLPEYRELLESFPLEPTDALSPLGVAR